MILYFIRHGATQGNLEKRYIGRTDQPLCAEGRAAAERLTVPRCGSVAVSPMKRCIETAEIVFPGTYLNIVEDFRECDFGNFEGKNFSELSSDQDYQRWIDSGGTAAFPRGESPYSFKERCIAAFAGYMRTVKDTETAAFVVHGGTIMSIFERFAIPHNDYYDWLIPNGCGIKCRWDGRNITLPERI